MRITFVAPTVVGYAADPNALFVRGLAQALGERGHIVRVVEPRQNHAFARTLRTVGAQASREFHEHFTAFQHHTFEAVSGSRLLEWVTREIALVDVVVTVAGLEDELVLWLANLTRARLRRAFLTYQPESLVNSMADRLQVARFDVVLAPFQPAANLAWQPIGATLAAIDADRFVTDRLTLVDGATAASDFLAAMTLAPAPQPLETGALDDQG